MTPESSIPYSSLDQLQAAAYCSAQCAVNLADASNSSVPSASGSGYLGTNFIGLIKSCLNSKYKQ